MRDKRTTSEDRATQLEALSLAIIKLPYAGPFTQLVWGATQKFGCGKARNSNGKVLTRSNFIPHILPCTTMSTRTQPTCHFFTLTAR